MTKMIRQTMFTSGEIDIQNFKRTDVEAYLTGAQSLLNCEVGTTGLAKKRKGTRFLLDVTAYAGTGSQIYEFKDKNDNYYLLLSNNLKMHIFQISPFAFLQTLTTPYTTAELEDVDYSLDNDVLVLTHSNHPPARIFISNYTGPVFSYEVLNIFPYPAYDFGNVNYNAYTVSYSTSGTVLTFVITNPAGSGHPTGFTTDWIGGQIIGAGNTSNQPVAYAIITNVVNTDNVTTFTANVQIVFLGSGSAYGSQYSIRQPAWTVPSSPIVQIGYPAKVLFYQNRLWFANTPYLPSTVFGSKINNPLSFDVGIGNDTDAIVYTLGQSNSGSILWMNGGKQLEIYTQNFEFVAPQEQSLGLTPGTFSIRNQSAYGSSNNIKPTTYVNDSYYVTREGNGIINFHFNGIGQSYQSSNISVASSHLVLNPINRALLRGTATNQDNFIYYLNDDASITAFQFAAEYKLAALTPLQFQTHIFTNDICTINNQIYFLKTYTETHVSAIEIFDEDLKIDSAFDAFMAGSGVVTGLDTLNGYTVQVISNGQDYGQYLVIGGTITVNNPSGIPGTITVGLLYPVVITPMYVFAGPEESNYFKNFNRIYVDYYNSLNFQINGTQVPYFTYAEIQAGLGLIPKTDTAVISPVSGWNRFSTFSITQNSPFDLQILAIAYQIESAIV